MSPATPNPGTAVPTLRTAAATTLTFVLAEVLDLKHANLATWTTFLVMAQYPFTSFQKGLERIVGRALGILAGVVLTTWFNEAPLLVLALMSLILTFCFYLYFAERLAYTFLNAGLYLIAIFLLGHNHPSSVIAEGEGMFAAILVGVIVADLATWLTSSEHDLYVRFGEAPLWPIRGDWLSHSLMLVVTVILTLLGTHLLGIPVEKAVFSVMMLTITPHLQALLLKGQLRIAGALLAMVWALGTFLLVGLVPSLLLLAGLLFLGLLLAAHVTRTGGKYSYLGVQLGLVLPLLVVAPPTEFGQIAPALERLEGIAAALAASIVVAGLWPRFSPAVSSAVVPSPGETHQR